MSILLPTTGRPERAKACVEQLRDTTRGHDLEIVCAVDADPVSRDLLEPLVDIMLYSDTYRGCSNAWNDCLAACTGDPVVFGADDLEWRENWLTAALAASGEHPGCLIGFNDGHWGAALSTHYLMPRSFIVEVLGGVVAWPFYEHSMNDLEVNQRARAAGRYVWCEDAHVYHSHWLFGDRPKDDTDTRLLGKHSASEQKYRERQAAGFPNDHKPVI